MQAKVTPQELRYRIDADYFGFRDEDDGLLLAHELQKSMEQTKKVLVNASEAAIADLQRDFVTEPDPPTLQDVEAWMVHKRQQDLVDKYL